MNVIDKCLIWLEHAKYYCYEVCVILSISHTWLLDTGTLMTATMEEREKY